MIRAYKENINGKIELTEEELNKLLQEARDEGWRDGYNSGRKYVPYITNPSSTHNPGWKPNWWDWTITY